MGGVVLSTPCSLAASIPPHLIPHLRSVSIHVRVAFHSPWHFASHLSISQSSPIPPSRHWRIHPVVHLPYVPCIPSHLASWLMHLLCTLLSLCNSDFAVALAIPPFALQCFPFRNSIPFHHRVSLLSRLSNLRSIALIVSYLSRPPFKLSSLDF